MADKLRDITALLYFISGLCFCITCMLFAVKAPKENVFQRMSSGAKVSAFKIITCLAIFILISTELCWFLSDWFSLNPIDYKFADMLPLIKIACERFLHGEAVYRPVPQVWGGENIPYLPAMWLPFAPALLLQADMRWTNIVMFMGCLGLSLCLLPAMRKSAFLFMSLIVFTGFFLIARFYTWEDNTLFKLSEEAIPSFYYLLLCTALLFGFDWLTGITLALCTLSRFSLMPFIPMLFLCLLADKKYSRALNIAAVYTVLMLVIFIIPFFSEQPHYFLDIPLKYKAQVEIFWHRYGYSLEGTRNLGLAFIFCYAHLSAMKFFYIILLIILPVLLFAIFFRLRNNENFQKNIWLAASLKLILLVFYNFISLPVLYIFAVPTLISYPILSGIARGAKAAAQLDVNK
jgi:hypothetical protein